MLIPSKTARAYLAPPSLSRRVNANSQRAPSMKLRDFKLIKKGEC